MDKIAILKALKSQQQIEQAEKKIEVLESQCARSKQHEQVYYDEVLVYHKKTAKLEQDLNMANKKLEKLQVLSQEAEKQNKIRRNKYFEACKKVSSLEAKNLCLVNRETYQDKQIESANQSAKQMEKETCALLKKVADLEQSRDLLDKKRREALAQVYNLQAENTELEESVQIINSRNCYGNGEGGRYLGEPRSAEELTECDRVETKQLNILKREKKANQDKLHGAERDVLESERLNSHLREQVADLKQSLAERDHQVKQCKKIHENSRRHLQNEICKLEETVIHWQEKYEESVMELEKETTKDENGREGHEACWECELHLRACQSEVSERDMTIAYLETINKSHEDKIRQIIHQYQQTSSNVAKNERDILSTPELHHQLQILLSFYKKRSENATLELNNWKELAVEARSCRENESALFESQLSSISKDYYAKYESCRSSLEKEKSVRISLEGQVHGLIGELQECESKYKPYRRQLNELRQRYDALLTESNNITGALHVTQPTSRQGCPQQLGSLMADSADERVLIDDDTGRESGMKHENTVCDAAQPGIEIGDCVVDGETVVGNAEIPVDAQHHMEALPHAIVNGSSSNDNREVFADDESLNMEVDNLQRKNNELQALCEKLTKEHDETSQTVIASGQQSSDMAVKCERFENEIQKLKQLLEESTSRTTELEKANLEYKEENYKLKELVEELNARIAALESDNQAGNQVVESAMASDTTMSSEVAQPSKDQKQEVEDALDEEFAAQELESTSEIPDKVESTPEIPDNPPEDKTAVVEKNGEKAETKDETPLTTPETPVETALSTPETALPTPKLPLSTPETQLTTPETPLSPPETPLTTPETPLSTPEKSHGHVGSLARTAPMPFKRHTGVTHTTPSAARQRTRSVDHTTNSERRESLGSEGDVVPADGKPRFLQKKLSMSHLDAFKPKPFKKQASLSDDISVFARPRRSSKTESTGSASDSDQSRETTEKLENHSEQSEPTQVHPDDSTDSAFTGDSPRPQKTTKEPPKPLPKPHRPTNDKASASFSSGFSRKEYYSGIRPSGDGPEAEGGATTLPAAVESNEATNEQSKDELVGDLEQGDLV